jgi:hypothetical protein
MFGVQVIICGVSRKGIFVCQQRVGVGGNATAIVKYALFTGHLAFRGERFLAHALCVVHVPHRCTTGSLAHAFVRVCVCV